MSFSDISVKKLDFDFYRGDTTRLTFPNISSYDSGQTVKFSVRKTPDSTLVISKDIATSTTEGNDWANFIISVNLTDGDSQLVQEGVYRYDLQVIRSGIVKTEYFGTFNLIGDITRVGQGVIDTITEANIYSALGSNDLSQGAGLVGVATTIWSSILTLSNRSVQKALEWLLNNKLPIPSPFTANRLIKLGASSPDTIVTGITITSNDDITGARFITGLATPTDPSHLTRKDYADGIPEDFLDSLGGTSGQVLTKDSSGYVFDEVPSADVEGYLDSLGGNVGDTLSKTSGGYGFEPPGGVEAYLDSLGGSIGDVLTKTSGGYDIETPTSTDSNALGSYMQDDFDLLDSSKYKPTNANSINRADVDSTLLAKLLKNVTSLTPGTDRVNIVGHGLSDGQKVKFGFSGGGITALTEYYVRNKTTDDFQLSTTLTGGILDLTSDQTGEILTHVAWGFGNGSTTLNTPDLNGKFLRPAGVSSTSQKANGSYYDGGAVGETKLDKFQGHWHDAQVRGSYNSGTPIVTFSGQDTLDLLQSNLVKSPTSDGTNGTPRTGDETAPVSVAIKYKVRIA